MTRNLDPAAGLEAMLDFAKEYGNDALADLLANMPGTLPERRKAALFVSGFRGHSVGVAGLQEQPYGYVGQCRRCGQVLKVPRTVEPGLAGIQGAAVRYECPLDPNRKKA